MARNLRNVGAFRNKEQQDFLENIVNMCFAKGEATIGIGTPGSKYPVTTAAVQYTISGVFYSVAACSNSGYGFSFSTLGSNQMMKWVMVVNSAGSAEWIHGSAVSAGTSGGGPSSIPASMCVIAVAKMSLGNSVSFNCGASALSDIFYTYSGSNTLEIWDVSMIPYEFAFSE